MTWLIAFLLTIPAANWTIHNLGTSCDAICTIPVWPGILAPSGVLWVGLALCLRDMAHRTMGPWPVAAAIVVGAGASFAVASPYVATASAVAFLLSEFVDFAVYAPLARKRFYLAMVLSGIVGLAVDSALFLWIAFASFDYLPGQLIGKAYAVAIAIGLIWATRRAWEEAK